MILINKIKTNKKILENIIWLFFDKAFRLSIGIFFTILFARHLGPLQFGLYNYSLAIISIFTIISGLGLHIIVIRELTNAAISDEQVLGSAALLRFIGSFLSYITLIIISQFIYQPDNINNSLTLVLGISIIFSSGDIFKFWFEHETKLKHVVQIENINFLFFTFIKFIFIFKSYPIIYFAYVYSIETIANFLGLYFLYKKHAKSKKWIYNYDTCKYFLKESWPLIISSAAWMIYTKIDQIMIGQILGNESVGYYTAATRITDVASFLPLIIITSTFPSISKIRINNRNLYLEKIQNLYYILSFFIILCCLLITIISPILINLMYGPEYYKSSTVLVIQSWTLLFFALSALSGRYMINDGYQKLTMHRHLLGVIINVPLNYYAIPKYGIEGAALSSLFALFITTYLFDITSKYTRHIFKQKTKAIINYWILELIFYKFKSAQK